MNPRPDFTEIATLTLMRLHWLRARHNDNNATVTRELANVIRSAYERGR